jgi:hypothetical protein
MVSMMPCFPASCAWCATDTKGLFCKLCWRHYRAAVFPADAASAASEVRHAYLPVHVPWANKHAVSTIHPASVRNLSFAISRLLDFAVRCPPCLLHWCVGLSGLQDHQPAAAGTEPCLQAQGHTAAAAPVGTSATHNCVTLTLAL